MACRNWRSSPGAPAFRTPGRRRPDGRSPADGPGSDGCARCRAGAAAASGRAARVEREVGARLARAAAADGHPRADPWIASDRRLDRAGARRRAALDERQVLPLDPPLGERRCRSRWASSERATTSRPDVSRSSRWTIPARSASPPPAIASSSARAYPRDGPGRGARPSPRPCRPPADARPRGDRESSSLISPGWRGRPLPRGARGQMNRITIPSVIDVSARLNGGQPSGSLTKSVTEPSLRRSRSCRALRRPTCRWAARSAGAWRGARSRRAGHQRQPDTSVTRTVSGQKAERDAVVAGVDAAGSPESRCVLRRARSTAGRARFES